MIRLLRLILPFVLLPTLLARASDSDAARPSALAYCSNTNSLLIADSSRGCVQQISLDDTSERTEEKIGESLVDMAGLAEGGFVAIDQRLRQLLYFDVDEGVRVKQRASLALQPSRIAVSDKRQDNSAIVCVTSRWSQAVQLVRLSQRERSRVMSPIKLGFEPQEVLALPGQRFLVADAFAGQLSVIDGNHARVESTQTLPGHNIRGLALTADGSAVWISHQMLSRIARSDFDDIHWGSLMRNVVSRIRIEAWSGTPAEFQKSIQRVQLGDTGRGFADPTGIVALPSGFAVLSGGARELAIFRDGKRIWQTSVGRRPTRLLLLSDQRIAVANEHDGTVGLVAPTGTLPSRTVRLGNSTLHPVAAGEAAFYDARLSHDSWMTCNSCHVDGHSPGLLADTFGDGSFGDAKRIPSLLGAKETAPYGWLGNKADLRSQIAATVSATMHAANPPPEVTAQLVDFVERLEPPPNLSNENDEWEAGRQLFESLQCNDCHRVPTFTARLVRNVGLQDSKGNHAFNPPSLQGLRFRRAFFHDARATSLEAVLKEYHHQLPRKLSAAEMQRLIRYLGSL